MTQSKYVIKVNSTNICASALFVYLNNKNTLPVHCELPSLIVVYPVGQSVQESTLVLLLYVPIEHGKHSLVIEFLKYPLAHSNWSNVIFS